VATEFTKDAVIDTDSVPPSQQANLSVVDSPGGTTISTSSRVSNLNVEVDGTVEVAGGNFRSAVFEFASDSSSTPALFVREGTVINEGTIKGGAGSDKFVVGGSSSLAKGDGTSVIKNSSASLRDGDDSVRFRKGAEIKNSSFKLGKGSDTIVFGKKSTASDSKVNLGKNDGSADLVKIAKSADVNNLTIKNFGKEDLLEVGGKTFDYDKIESKGGQIGDNISVELN
jgi:hypothetical protein